MCVWGCVCVWGWGGNTNKEHQEPEQCVEAFAIILSERVEAPFDHGEPLQRCKGRPETMTVHPWWFCFYKTLRVKAGLVFASRRTQYILYKAVDKFAPLIKQYYFSFCLHLFLSRLRHFPMVEQTAFLHLSGSHQPLGV